MHLFAVEHGLAPVGLLAVRGEMIVREARAQVENRIESFAAVIGKARQLRQRGRIEPVVQQKIENRAVDERHQMTPAPPSTVMICPVTCADASDASSNAAPLRSFGPPSWPRGVCAIRSASKVPSTNSVIFEGK